MTNRNKAFDDHKMMRADDEPCQLQAFACARNSKLIFQTGDVEFIIYCRLRATTKLRAHTTYAPNRIYA